MDAPSLKPTTQSHAKERQTYLQRMWRKTSQTLQAGLQANRRIDRQRYLEEVARRVGVVVTIQDTTKGRRVWIAWRRCHHGLVGAVTTTIGVLTRRPKLVAVGSYWMWDDRRDWPWPMSKYSQQ